MIFTEREAATKRCTPMQVIHLIPDRDRLDAGLLTGSLEVHCIGSRCAQWRWFDEATPAGNTYLIPGAPVQHKGKANPRPENITHTPARGYCGLAGKIE